MRPEGSGYIYLWEFLVTAGREEAFERAYGPEGEWVALFRRAPGYVRTELLRDRADPRRYITIDRWRSQAAWETFRARFAREFEAIDARCAGWTTAETEIGRFEPPG